MKKGRYCEVLELTQGHKESCSRIGSACSNGVRENGAVFAYCLCHTIHMKRTNLVLDEELLAEAVALSGVKTYSKAVELALRDFVRRIKSRKILELMGSGVWSGNLTTMRGDNR